MKNLFFGLSLIGFTASAQDSIFQPKEYSIEQLYDNTRIFGGVFSGDEEKLLVSSDEAGIVNLFKITIKDGSKEQDTKSTEDSFFAINCVPDSEEILYSADKGGNEIKFTYWKP